MSCDFYSYCSTVEGQYDRQEAARHSYFEKLNYEAVREVIRREGIECEFRSTGGGWDIFLTDEEFNVAKREVERMKAAGGYTSSLKVFEGDVAAKVLQYHQVHPLICCRLRESSFVRALYSLRKERRYGLMRW